MKQPRIPAVHLLAAGALLSLPLWVGADEPVVIEERQVKLVVSGDGDAESIQIDASDMEVGDSRQFLTDGGKEIVITRTEDGFTISADGKDIQLPDLDHGAHENIDIALLGDFVHAHGHDGDAETMVFVTSHDEGHLDGDVKTLVRKLVVDATAAGDADGHAVFISENGATIEIDSEVNHWVSHDGYGAQIIKWKTDCEEDSDDCTHFGHGNKIIKWKTDCEEGDEDCTPFGHGSKIIELHSDCDHQGSEDCNHFLATGNISDHLQDSGALDALSEEQRQKVLNVLRSFNGSTSSFVIIDTDEEEDGEEH